MSPRKPVAQASPQTPPTTSFVFMMCLSSLEFVAGAGRVGHRCTSPRMDLSFWRVTVESGMITEDRH